MHYLKRSRAGRGVLVQLAGVLYAISMHKYATRDALSTSAGIQAVIELLGIVGAFLFLLVATWGAQRRYQSSLALISFSIFAVFSISSSWRSWDPLLSFVKGSLLLLVLASGYIATQSGCGEKYLRAIYWSYVGMLAIGVIVGMMLPHLYPLFTVEDYTGRTRLSIFDTFPGTMGEDAALLLLLAPMIQQRESISKIFLFTIVVLAGGKTSTIVLCLLLTFRFASGLRRWRSWRTASVLAGVCALATVCAFYFVGFLGKDHFLTDSAQSIYGKAVASDAVSLDGRLALWVASLKLLGNAQALGYGVDGTRIAMIKVASWSGSSHNGFLELALSAGLLGFFFFVGGLCSVVIVCFNSSSSRLHMSLIAIFLTLNTCIGQVLNVPSYFGFLILVWLSFDPMTRRVEGAESTVDSQRRTGSGVKPGLEAMTAPWMRTYPL